MTREPVQVVDVTKSGRVSDAAELFFEYMAATYAELGLPVPAAPSELYEKWRSELEDPASAYPSPGGLLVAYRRDQPVGVVGMQVKDSTTAEVKHLYVQPEERGGVGTILMHALHKRALESGIQRLRLNVLHGRKRALDLYRRLGYVETEPYTVEPVPVTFLAFDLVASDER